MKTTKLSLALVGASLIVLGAGCSDETQQNVAVENQGTTIVSNGTPAPEFKAITINPTGIVEKDITISEGTVVEFRNSDVKPHWPASNPHPAHTDYAEFDPKKPLQPGDTWRFTFTKKGTWKFHDHLAGRDNRFSGVIQVQ